MAHNMSLNKNDQDKFVSEIKLQQDEVKGLFSQAEQLLGCSKTIADLAQD